MTALAALLARVVEHGARHVAQRLDDQLVDHALPITVGRVPYTTPTP